MITSPLKTALQLLVPCVVIATIFALGGCAYGTSGKAAKAEKFQLVFPEPPDDPRFVFERTIKTSADVKPFTDTDKFRIAFTGEQRTGEGMAKPYGIAVHHGRLFVGDTVRRVVMVFDIPEQKFFTIGDKEEDEVGKLYKPMGLEVDDKGNLYVLDATAKHVVIYDRDGKFLRNIGNPSDISRPAGLGVDGDGTRLYAVDIGGSSTDNHRVVVYDALTGQRLPDMGKRGKEKGEFNLPRDAVVAPDGSIYVVDGGNFRVQKFSSDGKFVSTWGSIGRQSGQFSRPKEVATDKDGNVYVVDTAFGNFQIFNSEGALLLAIGSRSNTDGPARYSLPSGIAVDDDGRVYVVDQFFRKVDVYRPFSLEKDEGYYGGSAISTPVEEQGLSSPVAE